MKTTNSPPKRRTSSSRVSVQVDESGDNLDKVRDILFGNQMRVVDSRLADMENRLLREQESLRADIVKRIDDVAEYCKKELHVLSERLGAESTTRAADRKEGEKALREAASRLENEIAKLENTTSETSAQLRTQILEQSQNVAADMQRLGEQLSSEFRQGDRELRAEKIDTASLIELLSDMAVRLTEELESPPKEKA